MQRDKDAVIGVLRLVALNADVLCPNPPKGDWHTSYTLSRISLIASVSPMLQFVTDEKLQILSERCIDFSLRQGFISKWRSELADTGLTRWLAALFLKQTVSSGTITKTKNVRQDEINISNLMGLKPWSI